MESVWAVGDDFSIENRCEEEKSTRQRGGGQQRHHEVGSGIGG